MSNVSESAPAAGGKLPVFLLCALGAIYFDEPNNVRGSWEYDTDPNPKFKAATGEGKAGLYEDIEQDGLTTPLWIDTLSAEERTAIHGRTGVWYDWVCLRGHRRGRVLKQLALKYPGRFDQIPCQVYQGLSESERIRLKVDQIHVKGLSDWGVYLAIKTLAFARLTEPQIAARIGMSRGFVQAKLRVSRLPQIVEEEFKKKCKGEPAVNLTDKNLNALMMAQNADENKGIVAGPDGTPGFQAEWKSITATGDPTVKTPTAMSRKELLVVVGMTKDPIISDTLRYAAGDPVELPGILSRMEALRTQATAYVVSQANVPASNPPTTAPVEPTTAPVEPTTAPVEPTTAPVEPTTAPVEPTTAPVEPTSNLPFEPEPAPPAPAPAPAPKSKGNGNGKRRAS
jgi:hypothetical protein